MQMPRAPSSEIPTWTHHHVPACTWYIMYTYEESKEIQEGSRTNNFLVGIYVLSRAERWEGMPSMSPEAGDTEVCLLLP